MLFDDQQCILGEGPLWHPKRGSLIWFDIMGKRMFERRLSGARARIFTFDEHVSAAAWIDNSRILIASESALLTFDLEDESRELLTPLEADNPLTRSNDGRADPYGGFWIGTMGKRLEPKMGAIYRYYQGTLRKLYDEISIPNSICFAPDCATAYFCDTPTGRIMKQTLNKAGWPEGEPEVFADVTPYKPDGSVVDEAGHLLNAQWGASRVARYDPAGHFVEAYEFPASQISCPCLGGEKNTTLFATSAAFDLQNPGPDEGRTYMLDVNAKGQEEHRFRP